MITYPDIDPVILSLGPLDLRWYGMMYLLSFVACWWLARLRISRADINWTRDQLADLVFYVCIGVIIGGRIGYMLFYDLDRFLSDPLSIIRLDRGGMSFHGGLLGVIVGMAWFARRMHIRFFQVADFIAPVVPIGLGLGRIGNFINSELWGKPTDLPWGVVLQPGTQPLHPSQLYEAVLEGLVLFIILWLYSRRPRPVGAVSGLFLICYGAFRFIVEFVRLPDGHIGYLAFDWLTMGQVLSLPMLLLGVYLMVSHRPQSKQRVNT